MHRHAYPAASPSATQLPSTPTLSGQGLHTRPSWTRPYTPAAESSRAASNQRTWTVYTYWPVSLLLTSGGLSHAAWNAHDKRQTPDTNCSMHHQPAASRLKSQKSCMRTFTPLDSSASSIRLRLWKDSLTDVPASVKMGLEVAESLPDGSGADWLCWRAPNRLRTWVGRAKTVMRRCSYLDDAQSVDCDCGEPHTMAHLLSCLLLDEACTADDMATVTERAKACARKWEKIVWRTRKKKKEALQQPPRPSAYGTTSIWGVKPSFARMVTNKYFVFCPNKCHICPNWGVNTLPPARLVRIYFCTKYFLYV